jgi:exosome complex component RRP45
MTVTLELQFFFYKLSINLTEIPHSKKAAGTGKKLSANQNINKSLCYFENKKKMKEISLSNNEDAFVQSAIQQGLRIDKRKLSEFRDINILFGKSLGSVLVSLGKTRVFASVSCEISTPKTSRPNEGTIFINVELPTSQFDNNALSEYCIMVNRILEKTIRDSNCLDLESLCIIAEEKVWNLRVDVVIVNHEGNLTGEIHSN